ncbi:bifunctional 2-C-methyl-D-erythritol 4-phosphate cytidylyltransferase/2-C-methyl-D-erythritol 2,4-cyclodiphosphate synthase [Bacillota bacterium]
MYRDKRIAAIVVAAGSGDRMGGDIPKQYIRIGGEMILEKAIEAFESHPFIDDIYLVVKKNDLSFCKDAFAADSHILKIRAIISGGENRQASVYNGLRTIYKGCREEDSGEYPALPDYVLIHDGARPFLSGNEISLVTEAAVKYGAAAPGVPIKDTLVKAEGMRIMKSPDRREMYLLQTPQGFLLHKIFGAHKEARAEGYLGTDDSSLMLRLDEYVALVPGKQSNIKITTSEDMAFAEFYDGTYCNEGPRLQAVDYRVGTGFDVHAFADDRNLIVGGIHIPWEKGLKGHTDADVLVHAVMDSLLGACGKGDIGLLFPDSDPEYKDISSIELLKKVREMLKAEAYEIGNIDGIIIAEKPKMSPYTGQMKKVMGEALGIDGSKINVKATTTEKLGFCGREEGIAAMVSSSLYKKHRESL